MSISAKDESKKLGEICSLYILSGFFHRNATKIKKRLERRKWGSLLWTKKKTKRKINVRVINYEICQFWSSCSATIENWIDLLRRRDRIKFSAVEALSTKIGRKIREKVFLHRSQPTLFHSWFTGLRWPGPVFPAAGVRLRIILSVPGWAEIFLKNCSNILLAQGRENKSIIGLGMKFTVWSIWGEFYGLHLLLITS